MTKMPKDGITVNKATLKKLKRWWLIYRLIEDDFWERVKKLEQEMAKDTGIKDIEIIIEMEVIGVGNGKRTMRLIDSEDLK